MSDPGINPQEKAGMVKRLMDARRAVKNAKSLGDVEAEHTAHRAVDEVKRELGERGRVWWTDGAPDLNKQLVKNTAYAGWYT